MERKTLLDRLEVVAPALARNSMIPVLGHFWFTGSTVMAYNDQIAISTPLQTNFKGAVPAMLLDLVKASSAVNTDIGTDGHEVQIKMGGSRLKLGLLPVEDFVFSMPKPGKGFISGKEFIAAVDSCMLSINDDNTYQKKDELGVTVVPNGTQVDLYATNNATLSHAAVKGSVGPFRDRVVLSGTFCRQMIACAKTAKSTKLEIGTDNALLAADNGTVIFGRLIAVEDPIDFGAILQHNFPAKRRASVIDTPTVMRSVLERAIIVTDSVTKPGSTVITVKGDILQFASRSERGEITDKVRIKSGKHPEVTVKLEAKLLRDGCSRYNKMLLTSDCAIMVQDDNLYLISATG